MRIDINCGRDRRLKAKLRRAGRIHPFSHLISRALARAGGARRRAGF